MKENLTVRLSGPPMLVTKLAEQALRPKRIGSLALPLAPFGGPLIAGVRLETRKILHCFNGGH